MNRMQSGKSRKNMKTNIKISDSKIKKKKKHKSGKKRFFILLLIIVILGGLFGYSVYKKGGGLQGVVATILGQDLEKLENLDTINVLLLRN